MEKIQLNEIKFGEVLGEYPPRVGKKQVKRYRCLICKFEWGSELFDKKHPFYEYCPKCGSMRIEGFWEHVVKEASAPEKRFKEPWRMTLSEYLDFRTKHEGGFRFEFPAFHRSHIEEALEEGKPVPLEVLKDYPDLLRKVKETPAPTFTVTKGFAEDVALRKRYEKEGFGLETVFEKEDWALARASQIKQNYGLTDDDIRLVKHISSPETGEKATWEVYVRAGKGLPVLFTVREAISEKPKKPWEMDSSAYLTSLGVHVPWIAEISPWQYAHLSKRQQERYDVKRAAEWDAAARARQEWRRLIEEAYERGEITKDTPGLHPEARDVIIFYKQEKEKRAKEKAMEEAVKENRIKSIGELEIGDEVYDLMLGRYVKVVKKFKTSVRVITRDGKEFTVPVMELQWKHYNELKEAVEKGLPFKPTRFYTAAFRKNSGLVPSSSHRAI